MKMLGKFSVKDHEKKIVSLYEKGKSDAEIGAPLDAVPKRFIVGARKPVARRK